MAWKMYAEAAAVFTALCSFDAATHGLGRHVWPEKTQPMDGENIFDNNRLVSTGWFFGSLAHRTSVPVIYIVPHAVLFTVGVIAAQRGFQLLS